MKTKIINYKPEHYGIVNRLLGDMFGCKWLDLTYKHCKLLCVDGEIIGFCVFHEYVRSLEIIYFGIDNNHRGKGYGKTLLNYFINHVTKKGKIIVLTPKYNVADFYLRSGFINSGNVNLEDMKLKYDTKDLVYVPLTRPIKTGSSCSPNIQV